MQVYKSSTKDVYKAILSSPTIADDLNAAFSEGYKILNPYSTEAGIVFVLTKQVERN